MTSTLTNGYSLKCCWVANHVNFINKVKCHCSSPFPGYVFQYLLSCWFCLGHAWPQSIFCYVLVPQPQRCLHPEVRALEQSLWTFGHAKGRDYRCQLSFHLESLWDVNWVNLWCLKHLEFHMVRKHFFTKKEEEY